MQIRISDYFFVCRHHSNVKYIAGIEENLNTRFYVRSSKSNSTEKDDLTEAEDIVSDFTTVGEFQNAYHDYALSRANYSSPSFVRSVEACSKVRKKAIFSCFSA